ncbi:hypothetical protein RRG08_030462 [Elysia crispata]|uniref:Uncharacterized protein n=1 Tax=Elysia crispata TaxID=231223 RepID=A0AAE1E7M6_9GAST|nr:hypothetical protein RRG08_030462 [Elysia crispata]
MLVTLPGSVSEAWVDTATDREVVRQGGKKTMVFDTENLDRLSRMLLPDASILQTFAWQNLSETSPNCYKGSCGIWNVDWMVHTQDSYTDSLSRRVILRLTNLESSEVTPKSGVSGRTRSLKKFITSGIGKCALRGLGFTWPQPPSNLVSLVKGKTRWARPGVRLRPDLPASYVSSLRLSLPLSVWQ